LYTFGLGVVDIVAAAAAAAAAEAEDVDGDSDGGREIGTKCRHQDIAITLAHH